MSTLPSVLALISLSGLGPLGAHQDALPKPQGLSPQAETVLFVEPGAEPDGSGTASSPMGSLEVARDALRGVQGARVIQLGAGTWMRSASFELDERDSGLVIRGATSEGTRLVGGAVLGPEQLRGLARLDAVADADLISALPTDEARDSVRVMTLAPGVQWTGPQHRGMGTAVAPVGSEVFVDGVALVPARWPNVGFAGIEAVLDAGSIPRNREADIAPEKRETGPARGGVFRPAEVTPARLENWARARDAWAMGYWCWDWADEALPLALVDADAGTIALGLPHRYGLKPAGKFFVMNVLEELDAPGEYFFNAATRQLLFWPPVAGDVMREVQITTLGTPLIHITGAHDIRLEELALEGARGTALVIEDCTNVKVQGCSITNVGNHGIVVTGSSNTVEGCKITGTGATGVSLSGGDRQDLSHGNNCLQDTQIMGFGRLFRTYQPGVKVDGVGQIVRGNKLAHAPHSAIIFSGNEHQIEDNEIFDVLRETGDSGAIYCGRDWAMHGTRIAGNFIHDLSGTDGRWQNAIYLDDMASGIEVAGNTIWRCHWGMLIGGGRDLWIHDNTFIECKLGIRFDARGVGWMAKNIADPATSTLHQRLAALPIGAEPWASRYPSLAHYLDDRFGRPAGSRVLDNRFFDTPFGSIVDTECVEVRGNVETEGLPPGFDAR